VDKVRREIKDGQLVKEAFDLNVIEGFGHVQGNRACQSPLAEIPGYSLNEAGQLQGRIMPGTLSYAVIYGMAWAVIGWQRT